MPRPRNGEKPQKGKKSVRWDVDPEILARLTVVQSMMVQRARSWQIAQAMGYTVRTALRDMDRVRELQRREAIGDIVAVRNDNIAQLREVQMRAWEQWRNTDKPNVKNDCLRIIMQAEMHIADILGSKAPANINHTGSVAITYDAKGLTDDELAAIASGRS